MRWSQSLIPTLRETPKDAEIPSHQLLLRAGLIRQLAGGVYTFLPLGLRVLRKVEQIVRDEMNAAGAIEILMPALHPREIWEQTGRATALDEILFKIKDRSGRPFVLGPTHEEIVTSLVAAEIHSYKQLPKTIYQIQTKFRDEPRPRFGLIRVKEFLMKDAYSFDADDAGAEASYRRMYDTYKRIFGRCGLKTLDVEAHSGAMGGSLSHEFMVASPAGEDRVARCDQCGYAANLEKATARLGGGEGRAESGERKAEGPERSREAASGQPEKFATPGVHTIEELTRPPYNAAATDQIKTMVYMGDDQLTLVLVRGDHQLNEAKVQTATGATKVRPAQAEEIKAGLGASPGSLGAVGVTGLRVLADEALRGRRQMVTGANEDGFHLRGVDIDRDIKVQAWADLRTVATGEGCPRCDGVLVVDSAIEVGHVFKLGTKYSVALKAEYLNEAGASNPMIMGCYGIGVSRTVAAIIEQSHDEKGICWPAAVAPYQVDIVVLKADSPEAMGVAEDLERALTTAGIDVIIDDRADRPGVKFNDAELVGFPVRITIGDKGLAKGVVEVKGRREPEFVSLPPAEVVAAVQQRLQ